MINDLFTKPKRNTLSPAKKKPKMRAESSKDVKIAAIAAIKRRPAVYIIG